MATRTDTFDLGALRLTSGEGRHLALDVVIEPFALGGHEYTVTSPSYRGGGDAGDVGEITPEADSGTSAPVSPAPGTSQIPLTLDISRMTGQGYALRLSFAAVLQGPCMRCLEPAHPRFDIDAREVSQPGEGEDLESPYVIRSILDLGAWARDALALALPPALLCRPDCLGLCPVCGENLNAAGADHAHDPTPDPRWAALAELTLSEAEPSDPAQ